MEQQLLSKVAFIVSSTDNSFIECNDFSNRVRLNKILIFRENQQIKVESLEQFLMFISTMQSGRITITGPNGIGKSSLLCFLKQHFKNNAFYLPINSQLVFEATIGHNFSSGEKAQAHLKELLNIRFERKIILLDEWDANLDSHAVSIGSTAIDIAAKRNLIIEIRHSKFSMHSADVPVSNNNSTLIFSDLSSKRTQKNIKDKKLEVVVNITSSAPIEDQTTENDQLIQTPQTNKRYKAE